MVAVQHFGEISLNSRYQLDWEPEGYAFFEFDNGFMARVKQDCAGWLYRYYRPHGRVEVFHPKVIDPSNGCADWCFFSEFGTQFRSDNELLICLLAIAMLPKPKKQFIGCRKDGAEFIRIGVSS